jgi:hypothetical protein
MLPGGGDKGNMPETGSTGSLRSKSAYSAGRHLKASLSLAASPLKRVVLKASVSFAALVAAVPAFAQGAENSARIELPFGGSVGAFEVIQFSMFLGAMGAALLSAGWLIRDRSKIAHQNNDLRSRLSDMNLTAQRNEALLNLKDQRAVVWDAHGARADVVGQLPFDSGAPQDRSHFLAFGRWLRPQSVAELERAVSALREQAHAFDLTVETSNGTLLDVYGRTSGSFAIVRFLGLQGVQAERAALQAQNRELSEKLALLRHLLDRLCAGCGCCRRHTGNVRASRAFWRAGPSTSGT